MAKIFCKYHPTIPARWACFHCQIRFCATCAPEPETKSKPECPVCHRNLDSLGAGNTIAAFWQRIPRFFIYPAHLPTLTVMLLLAVIIAMVKFIAFAPLVLILIELVFLKYAYVVLEHSAQGYLKPKPLESSYLTQELELPFKQILIIVAAVWANMYIANTFGPVVFGVTLFLSVLMFPASVMVLAVSHSFFSAINPVMLMTTVRRIGPPYLILCVFLFLLLSGSWLMQAFTVKFLPENIVLPIFKFVEMYFTLIMFNMMGYVIYQYHEQLGFHIEQEFGESGPADATMDPAATRQRSVEILLQEGKQQEAEAAMREQINVNPDNYQARHQYHKFLLMTGEKDKLRQAGSDFISRLLQQKQAGQAIQIFIECRQQLDDFKPIDAKERVLLADALTQAGKLELAVSVLKNLHRDFPGHGYIPAAYLLAARLLFEGFNQKQQAKEVLTLVISNYPHHDMLEQVKAYLEFLDKAPAN